MQTNIKVTRSIDPSFLPYVIQVEWFIRNKVLSIVCWLDLEMRALNSSAGCKWTKSLETPTEKEVWRFTGKHCYDHLLKIAWM